MHSSQYATLRGNFSFPPSFPPLLALVLPPSFPLPLTAAFPFLATSSLSSCSVLSSSELSSSSSSFPFLPFFPPRSRRTARDGAITRSPPSAACSPPTAIAEITLPSLISLLAPAACRSAVGLKGWFLPSAAEPSVISSIKSIVLDCRIGLFIRPSLPTICSMRWNEIIPGVVADCTGNPCAGPSELENQDSEQFSSEQCPRICCLRQVPALVFLSLACTFPFSLSLFLSPSLPDSTSDVDRPSSLTIENRRGDVNFGLK